MADFLYVCHFSNGHIKVGRSIAPMSRIASHADRVACMGVELVEHHIVQCVGASEPRESALIGWCVGAAAQRNRSEWFVGLSYADVCAWADKCAASEYEESSCAVKEIRLRLGLTQSAFADGMGCTQGNVGHYEKGQTVPPEAAKRLIAHAAKLGHTVTYEEIYGPAVERAASQGSPSTQKRRQRNPDRDNGNKERTNG